MTESAPTRSTLSPVRVGVVAIAVLAVVAGLAWAAVDRWGGSDEATALSDAPSARFAGYVDVTATPTYPFESPTSTSTEQVVLAFMVASHDKPCEPTWGAAYTMDEADAELDLERRLTLLRVRGGGYTVSLGGAINDEVATVCGDERKVAAAYRSIVERYGVKTLDFDLEENDLADRAANVRRAAALASVQQEYAEQGHELEIWLTLPAATAGLTPDGIASVQEFLAAGVDLAGVNAMTMNYGGSRVEGQSMVDATEQTLGEVRNQVASLFREADQELNETESWAKVGMTPMLGQNDVIDDILTIADAEKLSNFADSKGLGRVSVWSLNRDRNCGVNYITVSIVSDQCSGVEQGERYFADVLGPEVDADGAVIERPKAEAVKIPQTPEELIDDPATSPYAIWGKDVTYLAGTKVVWHRTVYQAKWWTTGDVPDDAGVTEFETPWRLIGPVLPGEKPVPAPALPKGTYPQWDPTKVYLKGDRVLIGKSPYRAKWWNQGQSPEVAQTNPDASAWATFTATEVREIAKALKK